LRVFEIDFEENLKVVRWVHKYKKRLIFPSTSEVYGMCTDDSFSEKTSNFIYGPINKPRWIYACSKQLMDRIIFAYGRDYGLRYTCFRPFNWIGPRLDTLEAARHGNSRVLAQFLANLYDKTPIQLVEGGQQKRCFTDIKDGLDALMCILVREEASNHRIFNIGNPNNVMTIVELAKTVRALYEEVGGPQPEPVIVEENDYYGDGFQDIAHRVPDIDLARTLLDWNPSVTIEESLRTVINYVTNVQE
ncbi:MAG: bifunctional UDP-4-keto-pentose/UDP-xylose synthase, partial [Planctomycetota bacterium]